MIVRVRADRLSTGRRVTPNLIEKGRRYMPTTIEVVNKATVLLRIPEEPGNSVRVILGGADGPLVTIDANGHIKVLPPQGPGDPEIRKAIAGILQGVEVIGRLAVGAGAASAGG